MGAAIANAPRYRIISIHLPFAGARPIVWDCLLEGTGFELSVPNESLAEDRDDGLLFRSRWRKMSVEERSDSAVRVIARERLYTDVVPIVLPVEVSAADIGPAAPPDFPGL
jgi:hypothetical protein